MEKVELDIVGLKKMIDKMGEVNKKTMEDAREKAKKITGGSYRLKGRKITNVVLDDNLNTWFRETDGRFHLIIDGVHIYTTVHPLSLFESMRRNKHDKFMSYNKNGDYIESNISELYKLFCKPR